VEIEVKPHNLVPDTNCFIDYLSQLQIIAQAGPTQQHYYTLMVPLVGEYHVCDLFLMQQARSM
jgi:protein SMG6